jgi:hypothetical protein
VKDSSSTARKLGIYVNLSDYRTGATSLASVPGILTCNYICYRLAPGKTEPVIISQAKATLSSDNAWGKRDVLTLSAPSDLEQHLVDGCLKLRLRIEEVM